MKKISKEQQRINNKLAKRKEWLLMNEPICVFCLKPVRGNADLAHKIRRSWSSKYYTREELQTMDLNTGLAHRDCHEDFDNYRENAKYYPGIAKILEDIKNIDIDYYQLIKSNFIT